MIQVRDRRRQPEPDDRGAVAQQRLEQIVEHRLADGTQTERRERDSELARRRYASMWLDRVLRGLAPGLPSTDELGHLRRPQARDRELRRDKEAVGSDESEREQPNRAIAGSSCRQLRARRRGPGAMGLRAGEPPDSPSAKLTCRSSARSHRSRSRFHGLKMRPARWSRALRPRRAPCHGFGAGATAMTAGRSPAPPVGRTSAASGTRSFPSAPPSPSHRGPALPGSCIVGRAMRAHR